MIKPKMIPLAVPDLRGREREYLCQCVDDNWVSSAGPFVTEMEARMAEVAGRRHAVATSNGTLAIQLALHGMGVGPGDHVIVPDWTFAATANAVYHAGATPYFVDVDPKSWTLDSAQVERVLSETGHKVAAIVVVDSLGHPADYDRLCAVAGEIPILSDAAAAIGARYKSRPAGTYGACAAFSFNGNKTVTAGGGGMIVTDDSELASLIRHLSTQARVGEEYEHSAVGTNCRMTNVNAAIGCAQLERLDEMVAAKRAIARRYDDFIATCNDIEPMPRMSWAESSCWLYSIKLHDSAAAQSLLSSFKQRNVQARTFWRSLSQQTPYRDAPAGPNSVSRSLSGTVISLPCSSQLSARDQTRVLDTLEEWVEARTKHEASELNPI
jgi:perosamine synthetase